MVIVNIIGGLGNQMFQYAFGYSISKTHGEDLKLDTTNYDADGLRNYALDCFHINALIASNDEIKRLKYKKEKFLEKVFRKIRKKAIKPSDKYYREPHFNFDNNALRTNGERYFNGYWQSAKYFEMYRNALLKQFTLKKPIHSESQQYEQIIKRTESVGLHIRRGDYVTNPHIKSVHGTCSLDYYEQAVSHILSNVNNAHFFVFSDNLTWARENLDFIENLTFIELSEHIPDYEEMFLMSLCKHNIIANSSFSWWGAWLNQHSNKIVIAPKQWFVDDTVDTKDLIHSNWIVL